MVVRGLARPPSAGPASSSQGTWDSSRALFSCLRVLVYKVKMKTALTSAPGTQGSTTSVAAPGSTARKGPGAGHSGDRLELSHRRCSRSREQPGVRSRELQMAAALSEAHAKHCGGMFSDSPARVGKVWGTPL